MGAPHVWCTLGLPFKSLQRRHVNRDDRELLRPSTEPRPRRGLFEPSELSADKLIHVADQIGGSAASLELNDLIKVGEDGVGCSEGDELGSVCCHWCSCC